MNLHDKLVKEKRNRWLDVGCGGNFEEGFYYLDIFPEGIIESGHKERYFRSDVLHFSTEDLKKLGKFDLVRMQHTFEHFSFEEGQRVLKNCAKILKKDGIILISTPDLRVHIKKYLNNSYKNWEGYKEWANQRIPKDAPDSFYFSMFAHSLPYEQHKWCYDSKGLIYQINAAGAFKGIKELKFDSLLSSKPFTHNRPEEDVCVMAIKK